MKVGDLVNFYTKSWVFKHAKSRYANPGLVLHTEVRGTDGGMIADVYWRNGKVTREHDSYLRPAEI